MKHKQFELWLADLNPGKGTEPGKTRPVVIVQTDLLNDIHPSTLICPITSEVQKKSQLLRVHLKKEQLNKPSDILCDQIRAIDNRRLLRKLGTLHKDQINTLRYNIKVVLDLLDC
jgi:mRNA interferase MazF